jgi:hypothetical protein
MKKFRFILLCATIGVMTAGLTGCTKSVYDEKQALEAQQGLLQFKYAEETKLELLRQSGASALEQLKYQFSVRTLVAGDSIKDASLRKRDIVILVKDPITDKPVAGAIVTIPTLTGTVLTYTSDSLGFAYFPASKNANVPYPASAIVSKTGYASGSVANAIFGTAAGVLDAATSTYSAAYYGGGFYNNQIGAIAGARTIYILNTASSPNTVKGKVYIETDLTNTAPEFASKALVSVFTNFNGESNSGQSQKFEWSTVTDSAGNYSISVPDLATDLKFSYTSIDATSKLFIQGYVPGFDTLPSVKTISATYYIGDHTVSGGNGTLPENNASGNASGGFNIPSSVARFHAITPSADSNGRKFYLKNLSFNTNTDLGGSTKSMVLAGSNTTNLSTSGNANLLTALTYYNEDGTSKANGSISRYLAAKAIVDTAVLYDAFANADNYVKTSPVLEFNYSLLTDAAGNKTVVVNSLTQKTAGVINNVNGSVYKTTLSNSVYTNGSTSSAFNGATTFATFASISSATLRGGKTVVKNLSYGVGRLKTSVR